MDWVGGIFGMLALLALAVWAIGSQGPEVSGRARSLHWAVVIAFLIVFTAAAIVGESGPEGRRELQSTLELIALALALIAGFVVFRAPVLLLALVPYPAELLGAFDPEYETSSFGMAFYSSLFLAVSIGLGLLARVGLVLSRRAVQQRSAR